MTADIRTAAQREAEEKLPGTFSSVLTSYKGGFIDGAEWAQARVTPTRQELTQVIAIELVNGDPQSAAEAVLDFMAGLAEGEAGE